MSEPGHTTNAMTGLITLGVGLYVLDEVTRPRRKHAAMRPMFGMSRMTFRR